MMIFQLSRDIFQSKRAQKNTSKNEAQIKDIYRSSLTLCGKSDPTVSLPPIFLSCYPTKEGQIIRGDYPMYIFYRSRGGVLLW
jgi:hypothetical protein